MVRIYCYDSDFEFGHYPTEIIEAEKLTSSLASGITKDFSGGYGNQTFEFYRVEENDILNLFATFSIIHLKDKTVKAWTYYNGKELVDLNELKGRLRL